MNCKLNGPVDDHMPTAKIITTIENLKEITVTPDGECSTQHAVFQEDGSPSHYAIVVWTTLKLQFRDD